MKILVDGDGDVDLSRDPRRNLKYWIVVAVLVVLFCVFHSSW